MPRLRHRHRRRAAASTAAMLAAAALTLTLALSTTPTQLAPPTQLTPPVSLRLCRTESDCISSAGKEAPNHYNAALSFAPKGKAAAFADAVKELRESCVAVDDGASYVQARCGGDVVELLLRDDVATFRVAAETKGVTPPWCVEKGCINGSMNQRRRILALAKALGWSPIDSTQLEDEGRWTPIFFNTDAVPRDE